MSDFTAQPLTKNSVEKLLGVVQSACRRYQISALDDFLSSCQAFAQEKTLNIAVLGRFKAGKSSFLNHLIGRSLLPVGAIPVTSVVTEIEFGPQERAEVSFLDGRAEVVPLQEIAEFVSEESNPENVRRVALVHVELPSMQRYRGIRFVDTPGLESVFEHNTDASLDWLPNVGLALVAVGVDPPLSQHDIELIRNLSRYTPHITLLLTKVDLLDPPDRIQVQSFVQNQIARYWRDSVPVFPYSVRPGFEQLRMDLDRSLLTELCSGLDEHRDAILRHKLESLAGECADFLAVALQAAKVADSEREDLKRKILGQKEALDDTRLALKLIFRHVVAGTRASLEEMVRNEEIPIRQSLLSSLDSAFPQWSHSLREATEGFDDWLRAQIVREMTAVSNRHRAEFLQPLEHVSRQLAQSLQDFRNRLSERTLRALGVPLRTTEIDLRAAEPRSPDVRVGKIFDRNWELLSWLIPMALIRSTVLKHYRKKVGDVVFANLSRLVAQWEDTVQSALLALEKEALRRLDGLIATIEAMIASAGSQSAQIRDDLATLEQIRDSLATDGSPLA